MIEFDRETFMTCRLCVNQLGDYQIVPSIQQQIKFCYDIEVNPFDGLPQLICKACVSTLSKFAEVKNSYIEKQKNIRPLLKDKIVKLTEDVINCEKEVISAPLQLSREKKKTWKKFTLHSDSSEGSGTDSSIKAGLNGKKKTLKRKRIKKSSDFSDPSYEKSFICRFCNKSHNSESDAINHINIHSSIFCKYQTYIKRSCSVKLNRVDDKPNICKSENIVVHSRDRCVKSENVYYYSVFKPKSLANTNNEQHLSIVYEKEGKTNTGSGVSDSEKNLKKRKKEKCRIRSSKRLIEHVVGQSMPTICNTSSNVNSVATGFQNDKASEVHDNECIDICDYSDTESCKIVSEETNGDIPDWDLSLRTSEYKTIQNVISVCLKKYLKKYSNENVSQLPCHLIEKQPNNSLKHKVLSIGRKIINYPGFSCIGILRYLEQQDLEVVWIPRLQSNIKKPEYVQIMIKLKDYNDNKHRDIGWQKLEDASKNRRSQIICPSLSEKKSVQESLLECSTSTICNNIMETKELLLKDIEETAENFDKNPLLKKILNKNPVIYPKQLPKKILLPELVDNTNNLKTTDIVDQPFAVNEGNKETREDVFQMPIITSTVSLVLLPKATESESQKESIEVKKSNINNEIHPPSEAMKNFPKIKVKPISELMSDSSTHQEKHQENNFTCQNVNMPFQNNSFSYTTDISMLNQNDLENRPLEINYNHNMPVRGTNIRKEYVVMNTVDIPCKRTDSPFRYLRDLLYMNNIILLDVHETMPVGFICLLKFRLMFQQESNTPVVLCLAIFYSNKRFCLKVKDINQKEIDISKLSANWQWEILKVYRGDVGTKLLENAQKIGSDVCYMTSKFLCYLKLIEIQNE